MDLNRHVWKEGSVHRSVCGDEYDRVCDIAEQLQSSLTEAREEIERMRKALGSCYYVLSMQDRETDKWMRRRFVRTVKSNLVRREVMKKDDYIPDNWVMLDDVNVYTNGTDLVITGTPPSEEAGEFAHSCDQMGCGSFEHVIAKGAIEQWDGKDWRMKEIEKTLCVAST